MSARGQGFCYRPTYRDRKGRTRKTKTWWIGYSIGGKRYRESSRSTRQAEALKLLNQRLQERGRGISRRDLERVTLEDLAELIRNDYRKNARRSADRLERSLLHLTAAFSGWRIVDMQEEAIDRYASDRLAEGAANATVNRELAALRRMFRLGQRNRWRVAKALEQAPAPKRWRAELIRELWLSS